MNLEREFFRFKRIEGSTRFERCTWKLDAPLSPLDENL